MWQVAGSRSAALWETAHLHVASVRVYRSTAAGPLHPPGYPWGELICFFICLTDEFDMLLHMPLQVMPGRALCTESKTAMVLVACAWCIGFVLAVNVVNRDHHRKTGGSDGRSVGPGCGVL